MHPLLTFATGLVAGVLGIRVLKKVRAPEGAPAASGSGFEAARRSLNAAESGLRRATVSGLEALEKSSATLRTKLTPEAGGSADTGTEAEAETKPGIAAAQDAEKTKPVRRPRAQTVGKRSRRQEPKATPPASSQKDEPS